MIAAIHLYNLVIVAVLVGVLIALIWWMFMQIQN